jgi:hypothetical protein
MASKPRHGVTHHLIYVQFSLVFFYE